MIEYVENGDVAIFDGLKFRRDKRTGYYLNAKTHKRLHVYVWEYFNGQQVPQGYHVHHVNLDKGNNAPENLIVIEGAEHERIHGALLSEERKEEMRKNLEENAQPKAKEWHGSEAGRDWHKLHYEQYKDKLYVVHDFVCQNCGKPFKSTNTRSKYCCNNCRSAARRKSGIDNEVRTCERCGKEYECNKYQKARFCKDCKYKEIWNARRLQHGSTGNA